PDSPPGRGPGGPDSPGAGWGCGGEGESAPPIADPVDESSGVVREEETPVWPDGEVDRSGECPRPDQPARGKVLGLRGGAVQAHADDLVASRGRSIPGSVEGDEEVPAVLGRELR